MNTGWDLSNSVERVIAFREERDWGQFHLPKELAAGLAIEAAELQELFLWKPAEQAEVVRSDPDHLASIRDELADVVGFVIMLAHDLNIDLAAAVKSKLAANARRYPVDEYRGSSRKAPH